MTSHRANHDYWFDLIPYYVNRTLAEAEREAFEQHLAGCPACRQRVEDWRGIAHAVYQDVAGWVQSPPPLAAEVRTAAHAGPAPSSNGHTAQPTQHMVPLRVQAARRSVRTLQLPLTLAAAAVAIVIVGALLVYLATRPDPDDSLTPGSDGQAEHVPPTTSARPTVTPLPMYSPPALSPDTGEALYGPAPDLGILSPTTRPPTITPVNPPGIGSGGAGDAATGGAIVPARTTCQARNISGASAPIYQTPGGAIIAYWPPGEWLDVFQRTASGWYQLVRGGYIWGWVNSRAIVLDGPCGSLPYPTATNSAPHATPTAMFGQDIGTGPVMVTTETVGPIPAGSRVSIGHTWFDGSAWWYGIVMQDGYTTAEARAWQLQYATGTPPTPTPTVYHPPTPTNVFWTFVGSGEYRFVTREQIGAVPPDTPVRIDSAWYPGDEWHYTITAESGLSATARQSQLLYPPPDFFTTPSPTWGSSPTFTPTPPPSQTSAPSAVITRFSADPKSAAPGTSITLTWATTGAQTATIREVYASGQFGPWHTDLPANGSLAVTLPANGDTRITYQLVVSNPTGQEVSGQVAVTISEAGGQTAP